MDEFTKGILLIAALVALLLSPWSLVAAEPPTGWFLAGSHPQLYDTGLDREEVWTGNASAYLMARPGPSEGFGTLMQSIAADEYRGRRVRLAGYVKAQSVADWAGLWLRVDGPGQGPLAFDNMQDRAIKGNVDWRRYEIVLDVPRESTGVAFGFLLSGEGRIWVDALELEIVDDDTPTTDTNLSDES